MASRPMNLEFSGSPEIRATRAQVWRRLLDPYFIARSAPGVEAVEPLGPTRFRMTLGFGIALLKLRMALDVEMFDIIDGRSASMRASGNAPGSAVEMLSNVRVEDLAPGRVRLHWHAISSVSGVLAGVGARFVEGFARKLTAQFWEDFAERVAREAA
ncbi:MAG: carbon monoxide dehydrogenase subunit G [Gemmatimonadales bacterium]|nr:carbon monoxide dehydrogenase subunit G [Gemmatimonadales bacterium]